GGGLLPAQHSARNLRRVGEVSNARFNDTNASNVHTILQVLLQGTVHLFMTGAQGHFRVIIKVVVRIHARKPAYRRIALNAYKVLVVVYFKGSFECILNLPDKDHTDLNGITHLVIHLDLFTVEVSRSQRYGTLGEKGIHPKKAVLLHRALIFSEQDQYA